MINQLQKIKIKFVDFWYGFSPANNYFYKILSSGYDVELCDEPDILIFSCYGKEYLKYECIRIFYASENIRPDFSACDYAITFDYNNDFRHYRLPLYELYIDQTGSWEQLIRQRSYQECQAIWRAKTKFCCMVVSNGGATERLAFFKKLSDYKQVDSGGKVLNNVGGAVKDKLEFIKDYRFVIAFENASYPGYTTEKIIEPLLTECIPVYWGDPLVTNEFNSSAVLILDSSKSLEKFIDEIISIDQDEEKAVRMLMAGKFTGNKFPDSIDKQKLKLFLDNIITCSSGQLPVAQTWKRYVHVYKIKVNHIKYRLGLLNNAVSRRLKKFSPL